MNEATAINLMCAVMSLGWAIAIIMGAAFMLRGEDLRQLRSQCKLKDTELEGQAKAAAALVEERNAAEAERDAFRKAGRELLDANKRLGDRASHYVLQLSEAVSEAKRVRENIASSIPRWYGPGEIRGNAKRSAQEAP